MIIYTSSAQNLAKQIRKLRKKYGMTQLDLAFQADIHVNSIGRFEQGKTPLNIDSLLKIMKIFANIQGENFTLSVTGKNASTSQDIVHNDSM